YFGEELGEKGEDAEGFSTLDGRTTIFDWWTTPALKDLWELIHSEAYLKDELPGRFALYEPVFRMYAEALQMKNDNLIEESLTYDLNYCNYTSAGFDKDRHFAFLKANKDEIHLFVCNFSNADCEMDIYIPQHAFDYVPIAVSEELNSQKPIHIKVSAFDAKSVRLK
ncbi:MAG: hypothetical protein HUJ95_04995, partial [Bacteroidales bacterium]|nr:hypothetical protein [Bacteroidales bacterium]